jgi:hypothetical protein
LKNTRKRRQEIADKMLARIHSDGIAIERDQDFLALIDDWVLGIIDLQECRSRYTSILSQRMEARRIGMGLKAIARRRE